MTFGVKTERHVQVKDITGQVQGALDGLPAGDGAVLVYCPHTTAGIFVNEGHDPDVAADVLEWMEKAVPWHAVYRHTEGNAAAHIRSILTGCGVTLPVEGGRLALGTWQRVFFAEFDGPRSRRVVVKFLRGDG